VVGDAPSGRLFQGDAALVAVVVEGDALAVGAFPVGEGGAVAGREVEAVAAVEAVLVPAPVDVATSTAELRIPRQL
jgi:hypothetical protein